MGGVERSMEGMSLRREAVVVPPPTAIYKSVTPLPDKSELKVLKPPRRPDFGRFGQTCRVSANHFLVELSQSLQIFHYDVSIDEVGGTRPVVSPGINRSVMSLVTALFGESHLGGRLLAYDGRKNVYTAGPLPFGESAKSFPVKRKSDRNGMDVDFNVVMKFASKMDLNDLRRFLQGNNKDCPYETIQALDVVLRTLPSQRHVTVSRSFYFDDNVHHSSLGNGVECWKGYYQSLRPTQMGLSLNIDQSATAFLEPVNVIEFMKSFLNIKEERIRGISENEFSKIRKVLRNIKLETTHRPGIYRFKGFSKLPAYKLMFESNDVRMSVTQYFMEKYQRSLKYDFLPCIVSGTERKPIFLPIEVCKIVGGQRYAKKLNEDQVRKMLSLTCGRPNERDHNICRMVDENNYEGDGLVGEFGLVVTNQHTEFNARILEPPRLMYGRQHYLKPNSGKWNMMEEKMVAGAKVEFWSFINLSSTNAAIADRFCRDLIYMCKKIGMDFNESAVVMSSHPREVSVDAALRNLKVQCDGILSKGSDLQLLIILLPDTTGYYGFIKRICETELGFVSQCCHTKHLRKQNLNQYFENVALKINVKVGGRNTMVAEYSQVQPPHVGRYVTDLPTIIFGADVTHPQPGEDTSPSIAAVVASMDWPGMVKYKCLVSTQPNRQEIISDLFKSSVDASGKVVNGGIIRELLISFYRENGRKPGRLIFYRDGVSEGQFNEVLLYEMHAIHNACSSLEENYRPKVTFIVVQKRHHTRIFPKNGGDRSGNIPPGTVVDTNICHPTEFDFYLCSHAGIQGTSRPAHYHVLYDENKFTADALQTFTNNLCYTFARCTRSVSVVPPAYYAHLAAYRARYYLEAGDSGDGSTLQGSSRSAEGMVRDLPKIMDNVREVMFFC